MEAKQIWSCLLDFCEGTGKSTKYPIP